MAAPKRYGQISGKLFEKMTGQWKTVFWCFISVCCFPAGSAQAGPAPAIKEKVTMIATQTKPHGLVPPMDRSVPAKSQTATFALG